MKIKVGVKPVFSNYPKTVFWTLSSKEEAEKRIEKTVEELKSKFSDEASILEPVLIESPEDTRKLEKELEKVDLFLPLSVGGSDQLLAAYLESFGKPIVGHGTDIPAFLKGRGREVYGPLSSELIHLLKVRKALKKTKFLLFTSSKLPPFSAMSSAYDSNLIKEKLGVDSDVLSSERLLYEIEGVSEEEAGKKADELIEKAEKVEVSREHVVKSAKVYFAIKKLMEERGANAVSINCGESIFKERKVAPCLAFTLLEDEGIPIACEADLSLLLANMLLMNLSDKSLFMGNTYSYKPEENLISISHDVPGLRMEGLEKSPLPYSLHEYHDWGYGTTVYVEMESGREVTIARFAPNVDKVFVNKGTIVACNLRPYCRIQIIIKVPDAYKFLKMQTDYGNHHAVVYGDYVEELNKLGDILGVRVESAA